MSIWARILWVAVALGALLLLVLLGLAFASRIARRMLNPVIGDFLVEPSEEALRLHATLAIADLHADALLWDASLLKRHDYGHVDVPRLIEGRVALQVFTVVTKAPRGMNLESNSAESDMVTWLAIAQAWPARTWRSPLERALHQASRLHATASASGGRLVVVRDRAELDAFLRRHMGDPGTVAGVLGLEGGHALEGDILGVDRLFAAGFRSIGLTHFFDNELGGSLHGLGKGGLTAFGRRVVARMEELGMAVDLAHGSLRLVDDVLEVAERPVLVSHTGVKGTCDNRRNLDNGRLAAVAATGGLVGIGLWPTAVCGATPDDWARAIRHAVDVVGVNHVGLGSDWDGAVPAIVDAAGTAHLVQALMAERFVAPEIHKILGENLVRVLRGTLPTG